MLAVALVIEQQAALSDICLQQNCDQLDVTMQISCWDGHPFTMSSLAAQYQTASSASTSRRVQARPRQSALWQQGVAQRHTSSDVE